MKPQSFLAGSALLLAATTAVIAGHDALTRQLYAVFAGAEMAAAQRIASPSAALLVHLMTGIFVLPLLAGLRPVRALRDAGRIAVATALVAVTLRTIAEMATGMIIGGLPIFSMAGVSAGLAVVATVRRGRTWRSQTRAFVPIPMRRLRGRRSKVA